MDTTDKAVSTNSMESSEDDKGLVMRLNNAVALSNTSPKVGSSTNMNGNAPFTGSPWKRKQLVDVHPSGNLDLKKLGMRRNSSYGKIPSENPEAKVLVLYTGGTIGMMRNEKNALEPRSNEFVRKIRTYPNMHDDAYATKRYGPAKSLAPLILPYVEGQHRRVLYQISEFEPLLDSSNMGVSDWVRIATDIQQSYEFFDGFVILHGTDTLSYTAAALSFMFENLGKTVIITGSQIPIFETRTDGQDNFTSALILAGNYVIPEVCVFFNSRLFRGNRTIKVSSESLDAFNSPNAAPLAKMGINVEVDYRLIFRPCTVEKFSVHTRMDEHVGLLRLFPSISTSTVKAFLQPPMRGVVLQTYGSGNIPTNRADLVQALREATDRGVLIVNCTQCNEGAVSGLYETGRQLEEINVFPGFDMTPEAALVKLAYVLSKEEWNHENKKTLMKSNLRGELTHEKTPEMQEYDLIDAVARTLHLNSVKELSQLKSSLFPAMVNSAVVSGDIVKLNNLKGYGANLSAENYDHRTALHVACCEGNLDVVQFLLQNGAAVHIRDRYERTPLMDAILNDHHQIIRLLVKCGAHLTGSIRSIGDSLCNAAARHLLTRLESYRIAGADLSQEDASGRTALHVGAMYGNLEIVQYLIKNYADIDAVDYLGFTPLDYAVKLNSQPVIDFLLAKNAKLGEELAEETRRPVLHDSIDD
ncbi:L-asparaginase isoform X2 [Toxorhynchites rutilus septentrionalis]|nr:L-asparaginase isoform X2 [Toxorhynchites rutilus septentrionalis]XP_055618355.1 L-asparaginase isoform X2 [Toxorhynchites rutilus septentrionalis]XP_055618360.1 L-asparaginase isoform X2 [Toxorhynchites rutilus septentrionalis]XP_055618370.1 L-asparaginase isoform X2 [Toxorhynchites rutilus septentrionalis]